jgi:isoquinoline 1-oxidoreductase subunit beta
VKDGDHRSLVLSRRTLIVGASIVAAAALVPAIRIARPWVVDYVLERGPGPQETPDNVFVWFECHADGRLTLYAPKCEMGQGIHTALAQIAAEELNVDPSKLEVVQGNLDRGYSDAAVFTFASASVKELYTPLRLAAATLREMLVDEAKRQLNARDVVAKDGRLILLSDPVRSLTYGEVVARKQGDWSEPARPVELKPQFEFAWIGKSVARIDMHAKVTGRAVYGYDARVPGMLYGAVARPPRYGARLLKAGTDGASRAPGVVGVVKDLEHGFVGVVCKQRTQAWNALKQLELEWEGGLQMNMSELDALITVHPGKGKILRDVGNVRQALLDGRLVQAEYRTPMAAHAHLEPLAALAIPHDAFMEIRAATQNPGRVRDDVKRALGSDLDVRVSATYLGGGFGRKAGHSTAVDAARLARAVGKPVHVGYTREEDLRHAYYRPPSHSVFKGTVSPVGKIRAIHQSVAEAGILWAVGPLPGWGAVEQLLGFDPGGLIGKIAPYELENYRIENSFVDFPVPTGPWRGLGLFANAFAVESFIDELAASIGADPLVFRLANLPGTELGKRIRNVLEKAADHAGWHAPLEGGRARGIACCTDVGTVVAQVAEVSVVDGHIQVHRVTCAVDPGFAVNPAGCILQAQGSIMMGLSSTLVERIEVSAGMVTATNFHDYPILTFSQAPQIDVLVVNSGATPFGMGEPAVGAVAPAVANAVFKATGRRLRSVPLQVA